MAAWWHNE